MRKSEKLFKVTPSLLDSWVHLTTTDWMTTERFIEWLSTPYQESEATVKGKLIHLIAETGRIYGHKGMRVTRDGDQYVATLNGVTAKVPADMVDAALWLYDQYGKEALFTEYRFAQTIQTYEYYVLIRGVVDCITKEGLMIDYKTGRGADYSERMQWRAYCEAVGPSMFRYVHIDDKGRTEETDLVYTPSDRDRLLLTIDRCISWMVSNGLQTFIRP